MKRMPPKEIVKKTWGNTKNKNSISATIPKEAALPMDIVKGDHVVWRIEYNPVLITVRKATPEEVKAYLEEMEKNRQARKGKKKRV